MIPDYWHAALEAAAAKRETLIVPPYDTAFRLLNGFIENLPGLTIDVFAKTAVLCDHTAEDVFAAEAEKLSSKIVSFLPFLKSVLCKSRSATDFDARRGRLAWGVSPDTRITENGIRYAIDLSLNIDNSFYGDTREVRRYLAENSAGKSVLNTFAYTGSLGVAAAAGGAASVVQSDRTDRFLDLARRSYTLNRLPYNKKGFAVGDFFDVVARFKREGRLFDTVILDPPFFAKTARGVIDQAARPVALINKVRPLIADNGLLIAVNNALYLSGEDYLDAVDDLCDDVYLTREAILPVPPDFTGFREDPASLYPVSPAPFNHPTKIVVFRCRRKGKQNMRYEI